MWVLTDNIPGADSDFQMIELIDPTGLDLSESYATSIVLDGGQLAIYGYGVRSDNSKAVPLVWHMDGIGAEVPEAMTASMLLAGTCALFLRRPRRA